MDTGLRHDGEKALEVELQLELQFIQKGKDVDRSVSKKRICIRMCILFFVLAEILEQGVRGAIAVRWLGRTQQPQASRVP